MAWKHKPSADRRLDRVERNHATPSRMRFIWRAKDETDEQVKAKMRAMIANGEAGPNDQLITYEWGAPAGDGSGT